jgi:hypothetical protein
MRDHLPMQIVEADNGHLRVAWLDTSFDNGSVPLGVFAGFVAGAIATFLLFTTPLAIGMALFLLSSIAIAVRLHQAESRYKVLEVDATGLTLSTLRTRQVNLPAQPSAAQLKEPINSTHLLGPAPAPTTAHYADMAELGCTAVSLWFEDDRGDRTEIPLTVFGHEDITRLHDRIAPSWERARAGAIGDPESARKTAEQLRKLVRQ